MVLPPSGKETIMMNKQKHLDLQARILIETLLNDHHSFKSIAKELGKDYTTVSKEVKNHISFEKTGALGRSFNDCRVAFLHQCSIQKLCHPCAQCHLVKVLSSGFIIMKPLVFYFIGKTAFGALLN